MMIACFIDGRPTGTVFTSQTILPPPHPPHTLSVCLSEANFSSSPNASLRVRRLSGLTSASFERLHAARRPALSTRCHFVTYVRGVCSRTALSVWQIEANTSRNSQEGTSGC